MKKITTKKLTTLALLTAMSVVVCLLIRFPLVPGVSFLHFDPKDVIIAIGAFIYGPLAGLIVSVMASLIEALFMGDTWVDIIMNIISTCSFVCTAAFIYKKMHSKQGAMYGLLAGSLVNVGVMLMWNYAITPIYFGMPREAVVPMLPSICLFNLLKCALNSGITLIIYKPVVTALRRSGLVEESKSVSSSKALGAAGAFVVLTALVIVLAVGGMI